MTKEKVELLTRVGPKGQVVLRKEIRKALGIRPGMLLRESIIKRQVVLEPFDWDKTLGQIEKIAKQIGKKWPKGSTSVDVIREERR